jgi:hypothetical protein
MAGAVFSSDRPVFPVQRLFGFAQQLAQKIIRTNDQIKRIGEKSWFFSLKRVPDELKHPARHKQPQCPFPMKEKQGQRNDDHRDADHMGSPIDRMLMIPAVFF